MAAPRMRPRFEMVIPGTSARALQKIQTKLGEHGCPCIGTILGKHVDLKITEAQRHFWSPQLTVDVEGHEEGTLIRGLFGPRPELWTFFVALYAVIGFCGLTGLLFGFSQWSLGLSPYALWVVPTAAALGLGVYLTALSGQKMAQEQMLLLRTFLSEALQGPQPHE